MYVLKHVPNAERINAWVYIIILKVKLNMTMTAYRNSQFAVI